jgi:hypothetical protein
MSSRWFRFILAILIGIAMGLLYAWAINPVEYVDTTPETLRIDYKTDYVLMVAESYQVEGDLALATSRLALLGNIPPNDLVQQAIASAQGRYAEADLQLMQALYEALQSWIPGLETPTL